MKSQVTVAREIVNSMLKENVKKVYCVPGESYLSVLNELFDETDIDLITGRQEGGISFMAEGYAKATNKVGVCFATRGPGASNLSIGLHTAYHDSTPLVAFIGQVEKKFRNREAFQEIDFSSYFKHIVKWAIEIDDPTRTNEIIRRAFHIARSGRPGPVVISLPEDILDKVYTKQYQQQNPLIFSAPRAEKKAIDDVEKALVDAKQPVIIAGGGISLTESTNQLISLSELLNIPVVTSYQRLSVFPNNHPNYIGTLWSGAPDYLINTIKDADLILAIGTRLSQNPTQNYSIINLKSKLIHIDISEKEINKVYPPYLGVISDAKQFLEDVLVKLKQNKNYKRKEDFLAPLRVKYKEYSEAIRSYSNKFVDLKGMIFDLKDQLPTNTIITGDAGNYLGWLFKYYKFEKDSFYIGPTSGAMGYGLPAAIGAKLAFPDNIVISFSGDGGFMMTMQELETAVRYKIPVISIVANNNMLGTIRLHQEKRFPKRKIGTSLTNPNFAQVMIEMGGNGEQSKTNEEFKNALARALKHEGPSVIEVITNPDYLSVGKSIHDLQKPSK